MTGKCCIGNEYICEDTAIYIEVYPMTTMFISFSCFSCIWKHFREFASEYANIIMNNFSAE